MTALRCITMLSQLRVILTHFMTDAEICTVGALSNARKAALPCLRLVSKRLDTSLHVQCLFVRDLSSAPAKLYDNTITLFM